MTPAGSFDSGGEAGVPLEGSLELSFSWLSFPVRNLQPNDAPRSTTRTRSNGRDFFISECMFLSFPDYIFATKYAKEQIPLYLVRDVPETQGVTNTGP